MLFQRTKLVSPRPYRPYTYSTEPKEWSLFDIIDWRKKIIIEVGCGRGKWILEQAARDPDSIYIGIERTRNRSSYFIDRAKAKNLKNLLSIRADALPLIEQKVPKESVSALYFFYPNPMPKRMQANQRFFVGSAFHVLNECLKKNGKIYLVSNIRDYVMEARDFLQRFWGYKIESYKKMATDQNPRTNFEAKYLAQGHEIFELSAQKST